MSYLPLTWVAAFPYTGSYPDYIHDWAIYKRFGVTVVYNSPADADKNATIYKILINK